jgi:glycosyltransferase involved in cell wall biosynthesis
MDLSVVVMAFNEEANLPITLDEAVAFLQRACSRWQIVVVDDGSKDGTHAVAQRYAERHPDHITVIRHPQNRGMGGAIKSGYGAARGDWVTQLPADGQIDPEVLQRFMDAVNREPELDIVLSRYRHRDDGWVRDVLSWGFQNAIQLVVGHRGDYTGISMFRRDLLARIGPLHSETFFVNLEFPIRALRLGVRHALVEIDARPRLSGQSKVKNVRRILRVAQEIIKMRARGD